MTTEEKAKAYDEALEIAKQIHDSNPSSGTAMVVCEQIFPELAEIEGERIRKRLINLIKELATSKVPILTSGYFVDGQDKKYIAWLEKQKYDRMKPVYDNQDSFESALEKAWKDYNDSGARTVDGCEDDYVECAHAKGFREGYLFGLEKQKEQKPVEWSEDIIRKAIKEVGLTQHQINWFKSNVFPPKQEWSEEDRDVIDEAAELALGWGCPNLSAKLKSILSRVKPSEQKYTLADLEAEWSEEDEKMRSNILNVLTPNLVYTTGSGTRTGTSTYKYDKEIAWLKSLRPQPHKEIYQAAKHDLAIKFMNYLDENRPEGKMSLSNSECEDIDKAFKENDWAKIMRYVEKYSPSWKPSEEQMDALDKAIPVCMGVVGRDEITPLESLYEQLKKLI